MCYSNFEIYIQNKQNFEIGKVLEGLKYLIDKVERNSLKKLH